MINRMQSASVGAKENTPLPLAVVCYRCRSHYGVGGSAPTINSPLNGGGRNVLTLTHSVWPLRIYTYILWYIIRLQALCANKNDTFISKGSWKARCWLWASESTEQLPRRAPAFDRPRYWTLWPHSFLEHLIEIDFADFSHGSTKTYFFR